MQTTKNKSLLSDTEKKYASFVSGMDKEWVKTFYNRLSNGKNGHKDLQVDTMIKYLEWGLGN